LNDKGYSKDMDNIKEYLCLSVGLNCEKKKGKFYVKTLNWSGKY
jgi:hypothetical protein